MSLASGEVSMEVVIDGATYTYSIPQISWEAGKRYIYSITMRPMTRKSEARTDSP